MTTTYDPNHVVYVDEADVRAEMTRVFDICHGCRRCVDMCSAFPTLFDMIDRHDDRDAGRLTPAQQDEVHDGCHHCKLCYLRCPYVPDRHESNVDFPRLMLRVGAMRVRHGHVTSKSRRSTHVLGRTGLLGKTATATAPIANRVTGPASRSLVRRAVSAVTGVSAVRLLPPYAKQRFSTWFAKRPTVSVARRTGRVTVFPTCLVEYQAPEIGRDLVRVYERNGIECDISGGECCGAPWLHSGEVDRFTKVARRNVETLAAEIRAGTDVVVPQPTCGYVLKHDYLQYVGGPDAELVAEHVFDAAEYLMRVHASDDVVLDTNFDGETFDRITYHAPCHLRAQDIGFKSRDLMKLTGARVRLVQQCSGIDGSWGLRSENEHLSIPIGERLAEAIDEDAGDVVAGDCLLANTVINEHGEQVPLHPLQVVARAYGITADSP